MKTKKDVLLTIYESHRKGVIDDDTLNALLEACDEENENCNNTKNDENEEDEIVEYKKKIEDLLMLLYSKDTFTAMDKEGASL